MTTSQLNYCNYFLCKESKLNSWTWRKRHAHHILIDNFLLFEYDSRTAKFCYLIKTVSVLTHSGSTVLLRQVVFWSKFSIVKYLKNYSVSSDFYENENSPKNQVLQTRPENYEIGLVKDLIQALFFSIGSNFSEINYDIIFFEIFNVPDCLHLHEKTCLEKFYIRLKCLREMNSIWW